MAEDRHQQRQQRLKEQVDARIAAAQDTRLLLVFTGNGKVKPRPPSAPSPGRLATACAPG